MIIIVVLIIRTCKFANILYFYMNQGIKCLFYLIVNVFLSVSHIAFPSAQIVI